MATSTPAPELDLFDFDDMPSMDELLGGDSASDLAQGSIIPGTVIEKRDSGVMVDIGFKAEGFIPREELPNWEEIAIGDEVRALLELLEDEDHMPRLSVQKAILQQAWDKFVEEHNEDDIVVGQIKYRVKGGLMVAVGVDAFLPGSQVDLGPVKNLDDYIGKDYDFKILKINRERRNVVVSRRELLEQEKARVRGKLLEELVVGERRTGTVKNITDFGAFIDLSGIDGLLHITDMSWGRVSHPSEMVSIGEEIEVVVLDIDKAKERVSLGLKQKSNDPWADVASQFPTGTKIHGRVMNVMPYGAFVEIVEGVEGLIHVSEMSWTKRITRASDVLNVGDEVDAVVLDVQHDSKKISLGLRQTMDNPWQALAAQYPPGSVIKGKVRNMTSYGAFIEIQPDIDGMVHVSDMSWTRKINNPAEMLKKSEEVEAVVLEIDADQQRISLGIKQLTEDPWKNIDKTFAIGDSVKGTVAKLTNFGAFVELENDIDGLIHISQLSDGRVEKVKDVIKVGDEVDAKVIKIDTNERRIGLSLKTSPNLDEIDDSIDYSADQGGANNLRRGDNMVDFGDVFADALEGIDLPDDKKQGE